MGRGTRTLAILPRWRAGSGWSPGLAGVPSDACDPLSCRDWLIAPPAESRDRPAAVSTALTEAGQ